LKLKYLDPEMARLVLELKEKLERDRERERGWEAVSGIQRDGDSEGLNSSTADGDHDSSIILSNDRGIWQTYYMLRILLIR
jgi:hypothetical protein